jgi:hypothetical protein
MIREQESRFSNGLRYLEKMVVYHVDVDCQVLAIQSVLSDLSDHHLFLSE